MDFLCFTKIPLNLPSRNARIAQLVEHDLAKVGVAGSSPVSRSKSQNPERDFFLPCSIARMVELVDTLDLKSSGQ